MSKVFKDEKIFNKFKNNFKFVFKNKNFIELTKNHFNKNGSLAVFTIAFLQNKIGEKKIFDSVKFNADEWIDLFNFLYKNELIISAQEKINLNPLITLDNIKKSFKCFDDFIEKLVEYIKEQNWNLNLSFDDIHKLLISAYGYILYNSVECKLDNQLDVIISDKNYENKYTIILNNTKLFSDAKANIRNVCGQKINDLIVILLGGSNHLALDK